MLPSLATLVVLVVVDASLGGATVIVTSYALAPFVSALVGGERSTQLVGGMAIFSAVASGFWNGNVGDPDHLVRVAIVAVAASFAAFAARSQADNAALATERSEIAETLQHGLLPPPIPEIPSLSVAALYRPAGAENEVGGDFYDAFPVQGGWMLVIGDVTGRGASAASITAIARYTLRTASTLTGDPLAALAALNRALIARKDPSLCSVAALALRDEDTEVRIAVAGHPPPLLVRGGSVREAAASGPVLGAFADAQWELDSARLDPGDQLVVYTDGVTEASGSDDRFGEERLRQRLVKCSSPAIAVQAVERALEEFCGATLRDDVALLALSPLEDLAAERVNGQLIERLFDAFNRRSQSEILALCHEDFEFMPLSGQIAGRPSAYRGHEGLSRYLADVNRIWDELLVTVQDTYAEGDAILATGRVYARSRELGLRDLPVTWRWRLRDERFVHGRVFEDPAAAREAAAAI